MTNVKVEFNGTFKRAQLEDAIFNDVKAFWDQIAQLFGDELRDHTRYVLTYLDDEKDEIEIKLSSELLASKTSQGSHLLKYKVKDRSPDSQPISVDVQHIEPVNVAPHLIEVPSEEIVEEPIEIPEVTPTATVLNLHTPDKVEEMKMAEPIGQQPEAAAEGTSVTGKIESTTSTPPKDQSNSSALTFGVRAPSEYEDRISPVYETRVSADYQDRTPSEFQDRTTNVEQPKHFDQWWDTDPKNQHSSSFLDKYLSSTSTSVTSNNDTEIKGQPKNLPRPVSTGNALPNIPTQPISDKPPVPPLDLYKIPQPVQQPEYWQEKSQLNSMGFPPSEKVHELLVKYAGDLNRVVNDLL